MSTKLYKQYYKKLAMQGGTPVGGMVYGAAPPDLLVQGQARKKAFVEAVRRGEYADRGVRPTAGREELKEAYKKFMPSASRLRKRQAPRRELTREEKDRKNVEARIRRAAKKQEMIPGFQQAYANMNPEIMQAIQIAAAKCIEKQGTPKIGCFAPQLDAKLKPRKPRAPRGIPIDPADL